MRPYMLDIVPYKPLYSFRKLQLRFQLHFRCVYDLPLSPDYPDDKAHRRTKESQAPKHGNR